MFPIGFYLLTLTAAYIVPGGFEIFEEGPTQLLILASWKGNTTHIPYYSNLNSTNMDFVKQKKASRIDSHPQLSSRQFDIFSVADTFEPIYLYKKTLVLKILSNSTLKKQDVIGQLQAKLYDDSYANTILYYTGNAQPYNGGWVIDDPSPSANAPWDHLLMYKDIIKVWKQRPNSTAHRFLYIIIESSYSGIWVKQCYQSIDFDDVAIMAATLIGQQAYDISIGGYFTYNLMQAIRPYANADFINVTEINSNQNFTFMGVGTLIDKIFMLRMYYSNWHDLFSNANKNPDLYW